jgi:hypothetical protein
MTYMAFKPEELHSLEYRLSHIFSQMLPNKFTKINEELLCVCISQMFNWADNCTYLTANRS